ncbi:MAG: hypothetical protein LBS40_01110 [Burkholderiales bacterium]|nr:hypothetical protein [Burkholderiales bacterium]
MTKFRSIPLGFIGKRVLWIVSFYRIGYVWALLGSIFLIASPPSALFYPTIFKVATILYFFFAAIFAIIAQMERELLSLQKLLFIATVGDSIFLSVMMFAGGNHVVPLPIFLFPQLTAHGWLLEKRLFSLLHAAIPTLFFLSVSLFLFWEGKTDLSQVVVVALICGGYFFIAYSATVIGRYTKVSELVAQQRNIDIANLEQINRTVIRDMKDGVMILDLRGIIRGYNPQAFVLLNAGEYAVAGQRLAQWSGRLYEIWAHWQETPNDPIRPFFVEGTAMTLLPRFVRIGTGSSGGTLVYLEDLSRARIEAQNLKLAALGRLTASIAHEIRNPLSAIQQATQLLEENEKISSEDMRLLLMIRNNGKRINRIVTEVLQLNRRDRRAPEDLHIAEILHTLVDEISASEQMPKGVIVLSIDEKLADTKVRFDRGHIDQILWNLLRNAWQFSKKQTGSIKVTLNAGNTPDRVSIDIIDDGAGIDEKNREQLFEPFFTTRALGTGLGLYIANELISANQASLELLPEKSGVGAHFRIHLFVAPPSVDI